MFCGIEILMNLKILYLSTNLQLKKFIYPDHYQISDKDINEIKDFAKKEKLTIITTEKDYLRLHKNQQMGIKFLKIKLKIKNLIKLKKILFKVNEKS